MRDIIRSTIRFGHSLTSWLDAGYYQCPINPQYPPIFIIGTPRSGTTLLYQLMMAAFQFAYLPNIANKYYQCPITATKWGMRFCPHHEIEFKSHYGYEKGCMAQSEAGNIWNLWFPYEKREGFNYTPEGWLSAQAIHQIRVLIYYMESIFNGPFLTKNVKMSVRIPALREIFPDARFIHIKRDALEVAISNLILIRKGVVPQMAALPKEYLSLEKRNVLKRIVQQIFFIEKDIQTDMNSKEKAYYSTYYHDLCENPHHILDEITAFLSSGNVPIKRKNTTIPSKFQVSFPKTKDYVSGQEISELKKIIESIITGQTDAE